MWRFGFKLRSDSGAMYSGKFMGIEGLPFDAHSYAFSGVSASILACFPPYRVYHFAPYTASGPIFLISGPFLPFFFLSLSTYLLDSQTWSDQVRVCSFLRILLIPPGIPQEATESPPLRIFGFDIEFLSV